MCLGWIMTITQYVGSDGPICGRDVSIAIHRALATLKIYFFANGTATLRGGYISVTPNVCEEGVGISPANDSSDQNRRLRCPRTSKQSPSSASLQSSLPAAASKKKKLLLLSQLLLSQCTTSTNTIFAGRTSRFAPQNLPGLSALIACAAPQFPDIVASSQPRARAIFAHARLEGCADYSFRPEVTPC